MRGTIRAALALVALLGVACRPTPTTASRVDGVRVWANTLPPDQRVVYTTEVSGCPILIATDGHPTPTAWAHYVWTYLDTACAPSEDAVRAEVTRNNNE